MSCAQMFSALPAALPREGKALHEHQSPFFWLHEDRQVRSKDLTPPEGQPQLALSRRATRVEVPLALVTAQPTLNAAVVLCIQVSGLGHTEICLALDIDPGHWTRMLKGDAHFPMNKLCGLMDLCGNEAPLMWLAHARGKGLVLLKSEAERQAEEARAEADALRVQVRMLTDILQGRSRPA